MIIYRSANKHQGLEQTQLFSKNYLPSLKTYNLPPIPVFDLTRDLPEYVRESAKELKTTTFTT